MRKCENCGANLDSGERCDCERESDRAPAISTAISTMRMTKLARAEFIARAGAGRRKDKLRGQKEAYWARSAHIDAERRKKR